MSNYQNSLWDNYKYDNMQKYPIRRIRNGIDILEMQDNGEEVLIGHTLAWCDEQQSIAEQATSKAEEFYNELIEAGIRKKPKTSEEMLVEAMNAIKYLTDKVEKLESDKKLVPMTGGKEVSKDGPNEHCNGNADSDITKSDTGSKKRTGKI